MSDLTITSIGELLAIKARILTDPESVSSEEVHAALKFTRKAREAATGTPAKKPAKAKTPAMSLEDLTF